MKKKIITAITFVFVIAASVFTVNYHSLKDDVSEENWRAANIEALSEDENIDTNSWYCRQTDVCRMNIGVGGKIMLFGGTIINANSQGVVTIDGVVICSRGGSDMCKPIECKDLYEVIFRN